MSLLSGHCIDHLCRKCAWPRCAHTCHTDTAEGAR